MNAEVTGLVGCLRGALEREKAVHVAGAEHGASISEAYEQGRRLSAAREAALAKWRRTGQRKTVAPALSGMVLLLAGAALVGWSELKKTPAMKVAGVVTMTVGVALVIWQVTKEWSDQSEEHYREYQGACQLYSAHLDQLENLLGESAAGWKTERAAAGETEAVLGALLEDR